MQYTWITIKLIKLRSKASHNNYTKKKSPCQFNFLGDGKQQLSFFYKSNSRKNNRKKYMQSKKASIDILTQKKYYVKRFLDIVL